PEGSRLPPQRELASALGVNRTTVISAYQELAADGLVDATIGRGTVVRATARPAPPAQTSPLPWAEVFSLRTRATCDPLIRDMMALCARQDVISFAAGVPAPDLYPLHDFRAVVDEVLSKDGRTLLQHCPTEGHFPLREWLAERMAERGARVSARNVLVLSGSQQGLDLVTRLLLDPGDVVVTESPSYLGVLQVFRAAGVRLLTVPLDEQGMQVDQLEQILARSRPKLIYTLPTLQNPTGVTLSLERRSQLLALAQRYQVPILEDDPYGELRYEGRPIPTLKAMDHHGHILYLSTFSKTLFPGLRLGWLAAPEQVIERLALIKQLTDLHTNTLGQWALVEFCRRGSLDEHLARLRSAYPRRRDAMCAALERHCPQGMTWNRPEGGFYLWCRLPENLPARELLTEAARRQVAFTVGDAFHVDGSGQNWIRLNFTYHTEEVITEGVKRLGQAMKAVLQRQRERPVEAFSLKPIV
ncbi:MAG: PLP-dependent aminotransferase family protein, partial [Chloroflexota bacterium]|nr:PLP-dependent aminotransferase family protein [Chloroflexota bacterium]